MLKILQWTIGIVAFLLFVNLVCTVTSLDHSLMYFVSATVDNNASETIKDFKDSWAIRGQIGDILSGHFSALAFLAVAFSIILQNEANRKMQMSIEKQDKALEQQEKSLRQQSKALEVQSESLKAQIEELQQSRKESAKQTEEFFINNMLIKLDKYYKMIDEKSDILFKAEKRYGITLDLILVVDRADTLGDVDDPNNHIFLFLLKVINLYDAIERVYLAISSIKKINTHIYKDFLDEFIFLMRDRSRIFRYQLILKHNKDKYTFLKLFPMNKLPSL